MTPTSHRAVLVVNPASGAGRGALLERLARRSRIELPVIRLARGVRLGPALASHRPDLVIAAGGDGTVAALLEAQRRLEGRPPVAVWPLGTGNDLARSVGWGPLAVTSGNLERFLALLGRGRERRHDRWVLAGPDGERAFHCYWSAGLDARIARRFHASRHHQPWLFPGGQLNKALYGLAGLAEIGGPLRALLGGLPLPGWTQALLVSNIPSYAGGVCVDRCIRADDGRAEVHGFGGQVRQALALCGLRPARHLGGGSQLEIALPQRVAMQVDGEPFLAPPGNWRLERRGSARLWAPPPPARGTRRIVV